MTATRSSNTKTKSKSKVSTKATSKTKKTKTSTPKKKATTTKKVVDVAPESTEPISTEELFDSVSAALLRELLEGNSHKVPKSFPKKKCIKSIQNDATEKGHRALLEYMDKPTMKAAVLDLEKSTDLGHNSATKMKKSIKDYIESNGFDLFLSALSMNVLNDICKLLGFEEDGSKDEIENALKEEATIMGLKEMLEVMQKDYLNDFATELKIKKTGTKEDLKNRILAKSFPHLEDEIKQSTTKKKKEKTSPVKVDIKKGVSQDELYQCYAGDLHEFCKKEGLKKSGNKKDIIKRILKYLEGDEESTKPMKPGQTKKRRRLAKIKASQEKSEDKSEDKPKKTTGTKRKATEKAEDEKKTKKSK